MASLSALADELGVSRTAVGGLCRRQGWRREGRSWNLAPEQEQVVRAHFSKQRPENSSCLVVECAGAPHARGYCRPHYRRLQNFGDPTAARTGGAELNRAKTHCPSGHPYSPTNTAVSAGRRRCLQCRAEQRAAKRRAGSPTVRPAAAGLEPRGT